MKFDKLLGEKIAGNLIILFLSLNSKKSKPKSIAGAKQNNGEKKWNLA